jgi:hypothetical protein
MVDLFDGPRMGAPGPFPLYSLDGLDVAHTPADPPVPQGATLNGPICLVESVAPLLPPRGRGMGTRLTTLPPP